METDIFYIELREYGYDNTVKAIRGKPIIIKYYNVTGFEFEKYCINKTKKIVENVYNCNNYILNPVTERGIIKYNITLRDAEIRSLTISFIHSPML